jgi:hypothetical protein
MSPPPEDDRRELRDRIAAAVAQGVSREALLIIVRIIAREVWRQGPWLW